MDELTRQLWDISLSFISSAYAADAVGGAASDEIAKQISDFAASVTKYALVLAAVGTVTMALLELLKSIFNVRLRFNRWRIIKWMANQDARRELELMATGSQRIGERRGVGGILMGEVHSADVLYDQPVEKMMGQIQAAANLALDFPHEYELFYAFLMANVRADNKDADTWRKYAEAISKGETVDDTTARAATQARARIGTLAARKLDAFQNSTQYLWAELNQRVAFVAAVGFLMWLLLPNSTDEGFAWVRWLTLSFVGGLVAPFAKDIVSGLSGLTAKAK